MRRRAAISAKAVVLRVPAGARRHRGLWNSAMTQTTEVEVASTSGVLNASEL